MRYDRATGRHRKCPNHDAGKITVNGLVRFILKIFDSNIYSRYYRIEKIGAFKEFPVD